MYCKLCLCDYWIKERFGGDLLVSDHIYHTSHLAIINVYELDAHIVNIIHGTFDEKLVGVPIQMHGPCRANKSYGQENLDT